jgi:YebC/PmpR family DNA-binding regulatory protein
MSGHSKWHNIQATKNKADAARGKIFTKIGREIVVAVKLGGPDPSSNAKLRDIISKAKQNNMPNDNIQRSIKKASGELNTVDYEETSYEGYGVGGSAVIVKCLTDNKNRTASNVRAIFGKRGGAMGETGSVTFNFERIGYIEYPLTVADADTMFEEALEAGANEVISEDETHAIETLPDDLSSVTEALEKKFGTPSASRLDWKATVKSEITDLETAKKFLEFIDALEEDEDVQHVYHNAEISEEVMSQLEAE